MQTPDLNGNAKYLAFGAGAILLVKHTFYTKNGHMGAKATTWKPKRVGGSAMQAQRSASSANHHSTGPHTDLCFARGVGEPNVLELNTASNFSSDWLRDHQTTISGWITFALALDQVEDPRDSRLALGDLYYVAYAQKVRGKTNKQANKQEFLQSKYEFCRLHHGVCA